MIANRTASDRLADTQAALAQLPDVVVAALPESPVLSAPTFRALADAVDAELVLGTESWLDRESLGLIVAAMSLPNVLDPAAARRHGDRARATGPSCCPGLLLAHQSGTFPSLAGIVLTGGYPIPETDPAAARGRSAGPADRVSPSCGTFTAATQLSEVRGPMTKDSTPQDRDRPPAVLRAGRRRRRC